VNVVLCDLFLVGDENTSRKEGEVSVSQEYVGEEEQIAAVIEYKPSDNRTRAMPHKGKLQRN
jgi:hypothetical protein